MEVIFGGRQSGKTTRLIQISHETNPPIVTYDHSAASRIETMAEIMGIDIPNPMSVNDFILYSCGKMYRKILVDEMVPTLSRALKTEVQAASICTEGTEKPSNSPDKIEMINKLVDTVHDYIFRLSPWNVVSEALFYEEIEKVYDKAWQEGFAAGKKGAKA